MNIEPPLIWSQAVVKKLLTKHGVSPEEVEEAEFDDMPHFKRQGQIFHCHGQTISGRYLLLVFRFLENGVAKPITAYEMTENQKKFYREVPKRSI